MIDLKQRLIKVEQKAEEASILASGAHRDVGDVQAALRAHVNTLEALNETQREMQQQMRTEFAAVRGEMRTGFAAVDDKFAAVNARFNDVDVKFDAVNAKMDEGFSKLGLGMAEITAKLTIAIDGQKTAN